MPTGPDAVARFRELHASGFCVLSPYRMGGVPCLRVAIANHRTRRDDLEGLVQRVLEHGRRCAATPQAAPSSSRVSIERAQ